MMSVVRRIAEELEAYARETHGQFVLINVTNLDRDPPQERLWIAIKFDKGSRAASEYARRCCDGAGVECQISQFCNLTTEFIKSVLPGSTVLSGISQE